MRFTQTKGGVHLHALTCKPLSRISGTVGRIALKCGMWLEVPISMCVTQVMDGVPISAYPYPVFRKRLDVLF